MRFNDSCRRDFSQKFIMNILDLLILRIEKEIEAFTFESVIIPQYWQVLGKASAKCNGES